MKKNLIPSMWLGLGLATGLTAAIGFQSLQAAVVDECRKEFSLLNPMRRCGSHYPLQREYDALQNSITTYIEDLQEENKDLQVSVYFRDLRNGPLFGIHQTEPFAPASLLKVPVLIAVLRAADVHPGFLEQKVQWEGTAGEIANIEESEGAIVPKKEYTIRELLDHMIINSDNIATQLLKASVDKIEQDFIGRTFDELGIILQPINGEDHITIKNYISIYRILYNSSFLSPENSQLALDLLTKTSFNDGIIAGLPAGTKVAHKYGIFETNDGKSKQLHDCGIVYHAGQNYLLCIMTRSSDLQQNINIIRHITSVIDAEVVSRIQEQTANTGDTPEFAP